MARSCQSGLRKRSVRLIEAPKQAHADIKHDISVPVIALADFIAGGHAAAQAVMAGIVYAPFGHFGDGNLHFNFAPPPGMAVADSRARAKEVQARKVSALMHNAGNVSRTARYLGVSRATLYRKLALGEWREVVRAGSRG